MKITNKVEGMDKEQLFYYNLVHNKRWYIENFLKIRNKASQLVPFKLNDAQQVVMDIIEDCEEKGIMKRFLVLKARQMGLSTLFEGLIFQDTSNNKFKNSLIVAHEESASQNLFNMSKLFYEELPEIIRPMKKYSNGKVLSFESPENDEKLKQLNPGLRSKITIATAGAGEVGRSATLHNIHASEVAFFPNARTTMLGLLQSVPDELNTLVVLESTANGVGGYFYEMWQNAVKGNSEYIPIFLPWFIDRNYTRKFRSDGERQQFIDEITLITQDNDGNEVKSYELRLMEKHNLTFEQMNWRRYTIENKCEGDVLLFMQEYPATAEEAFISSGRPVFPIDALQKYQTITKEPLRTGYLREDESGKVQFINDEHGYISIWQEPMHGRKYSLGADVAEGLSHGDYSCAMVGDNETFDVVAQWHGHIDPDLFGLELVKLGKFYNDAYIGCERNNHGLTTLTTVKKEEYWNIFFTKTYDKISESMTQKIGWETNSRTKPFMIDKLREFIREYHLGVFSSLAISEMFTYIIEDNGSTNAQDGSHDDTVVALAIMLQLMLEGRGSEYTPEVPIDQRGNYKPEVIDSLFESQREEIEISG